MFLNLAEADNPTSLEGLLVAARKQYQLWFAARKDKQRWTEEEGQWWDANHKLIVPPDQGVRHRLMHAYHDGLAAHPGWDETSRWVLDRFTWPGVRTWIKQYVKGCATCQQNKNLTHKTKAPLYKITVPHDNPPFSQVAMDLITGLPKS